jgi:hypothetical protein
MVTGGAYHKINLLFRIKGRKAEFFFVVVGGGGGGGGGLGKAGGWHK